MLYNHRIVPGNTLVHWRQDLGHYIRLDDTIPITSEWTAEEAVEILKMKSGEWEEIIGSWSFLADYLDIWFSKYLSDLLSLVPLKGLTVEEIRKLNEVKK